jgi:deoxyribodipyrimidine photo-lyase
LYHFEPDGFGKRISAMACALNIVWFKRDLRIADHRPLVEALSQGPTALLYVFELAYWQQDDVSARQYEFTRECVADLSRTVSARGGTLTIRVGDVVDVLQELHGSHGIAAVWSHQETGSAWTFTRDKRVGQWAKANGVDWREYQQQGVTRGLDDRDQWAARHSHFIMKSVMAAPQTFQTVHLASHPLPFASSLKRADDPCPLRQRGGREEALLLFDSFIAKRGRKYTFEMSSPITAVESCSRLSPHLALGTISIREAMQWAYAARQDIAAQPADVRSIELRSLDSFVSRLHWHCHFIQKLESEPAIEFQSMHPEFEKARTKHAEHGVWLEAFAKGQTGFPFVDACMRSLIATGWINFRMRAMLVAFACYHLALDWRDVGLVLARLFTDYEPGIHWPQVQMQAGQTGINVPRIYNPVKQSWDQDPNGVFIRRWVPELAKLSLPCLHEPWTLSREERRSVDYPPPLVDHVEAMRAARERLSAVRKVAGFQTTAKRVYQRHGSRKRTLKDDHPQKTKAKAAAKASLAKTQLSLDF